VIFLPAVWRVCVISYEPPLSLHRNLLLYYAARYVTQPKLSNVQSCILSILRQLQVTHNNHSTCSHVHTWPPTVTWYTIAAYHMPCLWSQLITHMKCNIAHMYCWHFTELLSLYLNHTMVYTDGFFVQRSTWWPGLFLSSPMVLTVFSLPNCMLCTELLCSSTIYCGSVISSAQTSWVPCRVSVVTHPTIRLSLIFWFKCSTFMRQGCLCILLDTWPHWPTLQQGYWYNG
jgi:hypothetical protein